MLSLRKEIQEYSRSCERLISGALTPDSTSFTTDEILLIAYYANEMTCLVDQLLRQPQLQQYQRQQSVQEYARASEALLLVNDLSQEERESIRCSIRDVTAKILNGGQVLRLDGGQVEALDNSE
jgi:hypothetical protein